jgi:hypothetical protein
MASCSGGVFRCDLGLSGAIFSSDLFCFEILSSEAESADSGLLKGSDLCINSVEIVSVTKEIEVYGLPMSSLFLKVKGCGSAVELWLIFSSSFSLKFSNSSFLI